MNLGYFTEAGKLQLTGYLRSDVVIGAGGVEDKSNSPLSSIVPKRCGDERLHGHSRRCFLTLKDCCRAVRSICCRDGGDGFTLSTGSVLSFWRWLRH